MKDFPESSGAISRHLLRRKAVLSKGQGMRENEGVGTPTWQAAADNMITEESYCGIMFGRSTNVTTVAMNAFANRESMVETLL